MAYEPNSGKAALCGPFNSPFAPPSAQDNKNGTFPGADTVNAPADDTSVVGVALFAKADSLMGMSPGALSSPMGTGINNPKK